MSALGFDTSNYTASVAWTDGKSDISIRELLAVKKGERGIRQSEGVFQHMKLVPELFDRLCRKTDIGSVKAVGVSSRPRNVEGSYMPVFLAGEGYARTVSAALGVPLHRFSHQDGHIMAGIYSGDALELLDGDFLSVHLSGGTTEILKSRYTGCGFENKIIGGTRDISAGQFIDRIGVKMGLAFPAGVELEKMALRADSIYKLPVSAEEAYMSFSGVETKVNRLIDEKDITNPEIRFQIAAGVQECVKNTLVKTVGAAIKKENINRVLIVGGVASNKSIREGLIRELDAEVYFAKAEYSSDNAAGIAYLAQLAGKED